MGKILVTGGAGYIGSACVKALCDAGYEVTVFDNLSNGEQKYVDERAQFIQGDILNATALEETFAAAKPSVVIHTAALKAVGESEEQLERYFENNVSGTIQVLTKAAEHNVQHVLFSSTASVYEETGEGIYTEDCPVASKNVYGTTKVLSEKVITEFARTGKLPTYTIFRYFNVGGDAGLKYKEKNAQNVLPNIQRAVTTGAEFKVFGNDYDTHDGTCIRDYIHLDDLVAAHMRAIDGSVNGVFNLGTGKGTSVLELLETFRKVVGKEIQYSIEGRRPGDPARAIANAQLAHERLGWSAKKDIEEIVQTLID